jgi:hypothetical protein
MVHAKTTMGGSSSSKLVMETRMEKSYFGRPIIVHDTIFDATSFPSIDAGIHIIPSSTTITYTTHL